MTGNDDKARARLLAVLSRHVGSHRAVGMDVLYERVFDEPVTHKINGTRRLRRLVTQLRHEGIPIGAVSASSGGGYYLIGAGSELDDYLSKRTRQALKILVLVARMKGITLPDQLGQMQLNLQGRAGGSENG